MFFSSPTTVPRETADHSLGAHSPHVYQTQLFKFKRHDSLHFSNSGLWRIQRGFVRTLTWNESGDFIPLGFWQTGDVIGSAIAQATPYKAQCLTPVVAEYLGSRYAFSKSDVLAQVKQSNELLQISHCRNAETRLLSFLCWAARQFGQLSVLANSEGERTECYRHRLKLTHQEIGESIGITRVTVTRLLKGLENDGFIQWNAKEKVIFPKAFRRCYDSVLSKGLLFKDGAVAKEDASYKREAALKRGP